MKRLVIRSILISAGLVAIGLFHAAPIHAYTNNRMIDDQVFDNVNSMNETQIRSFIAGHPNTCLTRVGAGFGGGNVFPNPVNYFTYDSGNLVDAAHVIYASAQQWGINPQVLITTLQKEQALITDNDCLDPQGFPTLHKAMGQGCAEGGPCPSAAYDGFSQQVMKGAWQLKFDKERAYGNLAWDGDQGVKYWGYMTQGNRARCGQTSNQCSSADLQVLHYDGFATLDGQSTYIENGATAALYTYTPHLNQSFPGIFTSWFGSTYSAAYSAQYAGQSAWPTLLAGTNYNGFFEYQNAGNVAWYDDTSLNSAPAGTKPVHLATSNPSNRISAFGSQWTNQNRPSLNFSTVYEADGSTLATDQHVVQPGQIARYNFTYVTPGNLPAGIYHEAFMPVLEGSPSGGFNDPGTFLNITVAPTIFSSTYAGQSSYQSLLETQNADVFLKYQNTGNATWYDDAGVANAPIGTQPVHLATSHGINRPSNFGATWNRDKNRPSGLFAAVYEADGTTLASNQHTATPGQIVKFGFNLRAGRNLPPAIYREYFQPIVEGGDLMNDPGTFLDITVNAANYLATYAGQCSYPTLTAGGTSVQCFFRYQNIGNIAWYDDPNLSSAPVGTNPIHLATSNPINRASVFGSLWNPDRNRPTGNLAKVYAADGSTEIVGATKVNPGQIGEYRFSLVAGAGQAPGVYRESFHLLEEGGSIMNDPGTFIDITVH